MTTKNETPVKPGDLVKLRFPRTIDDFWHVRVLAKIGSRFEHVKPHFGFSFLYVGRMSSIDEIEACYHDQAPGDEAGYTPVTPWIWMLGSESLLLGVSLSFVENV